MVEQLDLFDDFEGRAAALNMAIDEALLEVAVVPTLRFYRWNGLALSFGYFGSYAEAAREAGDREMVRRWTGGGIVPHGEDLTYSIILPASNPLFAESSREIYAAVHEAIQRALQINGIVASLVERAAPRISDLCFANAVHADLISDGSKIAGAAHRRTRRGLLHQGSIQSHNLPAKFRTDLAQMLCERYQPRRMPPDLLRRAEAIRDCKYGSREWLTRR